MTNTFFVHKAPEVITGGEKGRKGAMDIWSLGCCIVEMTTGRRPWSNLDNEWAVMYHVATGCPPLPEASQLSEEGIDFLKQCFIRSAHKRPSAQELLQHPWITNYLDLCDEEMRYEGDEDHDGSHHHLAAKSPELKAVGASSSRIVRSIAGSMPLEGHPDHVIGGAQAQQYFRNIGVNGRHDSQSSSGHQASSPTTSINNNEAEAHPDLIAPSPSLDNGTIRSESSMRSEASSIQYNEPPPIPNLPHLSSASSLRSEASSHNEA
jgi:serine/threonine protein kinase